MSRPRKTTRGQKIAEGVPFTAEIVQRHLDHAGIRENLDTGKLAQTLNQWRRLAETERASVPFQQGHPALGGMEIHSGIGAAANRRDRALD